MSDEDDEPVENQARVYMRTSAANGFDGNEVEVTVEGGPGDTVDDVEEVAEERFEQAVDRTGCDDTNHKGFE